MQNFPAAGARVPAATTASGRPLTLPGTLTSATAEELERDRLLGPAAASGAGRQFARCFLRWPRALDHIRLPALRALAANRPVDPNDPDVWSSRDEHAQAILRRHGVAKLSAARLTLAAIGELIAGQAQADRDAGLDWNTIAVPPASLDEPLRRTHSRLAISLDDPAIYAHRADQRHALSRTLGVSAEQADDLSRWVLTHHDQFHTDDLRCWRIGSRIWLELCDEQLPAVDRVERPVGLFVIPAVHAREGWQLTPVFSLEAIRLLVSLGATLERDLRSAALPAAAVPRLLERINLRTLHAGPKECLDSASQLAQELGRELGQPIAAAVPRERRDRWGRLLARRRTYRGPGGVRVAEVELRAITFPARGFTQRRLGAAPRDDRYGQLSAVMDLGEAVQTAVERELPLLLSTEAAGHLKDAVRVGRMKGRPGVLTITTSDGLSASTRRLVAEQAVSELRALKRGKTNVTLDAGARQAVRMTLARPLDDDPVLLGRQREMAALKVVGSGVDASAVGTGKTISSGRALAHRATTQPRFRGLVVAEGRLLGQWREELERGALGRGLPPLAPNVELLVISDDRQVAGQIRQFDRELADRPGVVLAANSVLDRYPADLQTIRWHLLIADEALRYANPATEAHQALAQVRFGAVADCWLLSATPRGKSSEHLDVLVGLALGDEAMIRERLNTREAGDLMDEIHAHRLRVNYGPHLVRVTRQDMQAWMPRVRPAQPLALDPDPALAELLDEVREGGREAYRRLLELLRELKTLEAGSELFKRALAELARVQGVVLGNVGVYVDASVDSADTDALQGRPRPGTGPPGTRARGDARRRRRPAAAARDHRTDARRRGGRGAGDRVRRARLVPAPARRNAQRPSRRRGVRRRRAGQRPRVRAAQTALHRRRVPDPVPQPGRARGPQPPERLGPHPPRSAVGPDRPGAARRPRRPPRRRQGMGADLHPLHPRRRDRAHRSESSRHEAPSTIRSSTASRASAPANRRSPPSSARSPARSPTARTTPGSPAPPPACGSPPACSAPEPVLDRQAAEPRVTSQRSKGGRADERDQRCP